jgi:uncharacterized membrane protein
MALDSKNYRPEVIAGATMTAINGQAPVAGGTVAISIGDSTTPNIYAGVGAPTVQATQGSLYLRTDGSSTSTRMYINTTGSTVWTAVTTAA